MHGGLDTTALYESAGVYPCVVRLKILLLSYQ